MGWRGVEKNTVTGIQSLKMESWRSKSKSKGKEVGLDRLMDAIALVWNEFQRSLLLLVAAGIVALYIEFCHQSHCRGNGLLS